jgi:xanthine/uracil permease
MRYRVLSVILAVAHWGLGIVFAFAAWIVGALACDEACYGEGDWSRTHESWQWDGVLVLAVASALLTTAFAIAVFGARIRAAAVFFGLQVGATIAIFAFLVDAEYTTIAPWVPPAVVAVEVVGMLALLVGGKVSDP